MPADSLLRLVRLFAAALIIGCNADSLVSVRPNARSESVSVRLGQEIDVTLGNVGPAQYLSPPSISSPVVTFIAVDVVPPFTPAGPNQRFRLKAASVGAAIVDFRRALGDSIVSVVEDTIHVR